ncbi:MAG: hypothetical protein PHX44_06245 [Sulfurimonas sp.]|uniref:hypothetical protein n=1 Tax=Sulfurimonas sp. TaxID=2022749 RepID=UPI002621E57A|nr:hypothetical protein [Sulfurimonas sp.]MDD2652632.1 hypothetical protein [Sulfurimonas sp.]MDD3450774.1 hypothetical protein [Sulfurimonas sp.]
MIKLLLILTVPFLLHAAKILSYNIYDRTDRVDVMITFDTPYNGVIKQNTTNSILTIKLEDASIESSKVKQLASKFIRSIAITPMNDHTQIVAEIPPNVALQASKTSDSYGLRLRFATPSAVQNSSETNDVSADELASLPTKKSNDLAGSYYLVIAILVAGIAILFYIKKRVVQPQTKQTQSSWLFQESNLEEKKEVHSVPSSAYAQNVTIRFQKALNSDNSVVMLDFGEQSYLVLMGKSNILLDKFSGDKPVTEDDFNAILQNRHKELENFLNNDDKHQESLRIYKEKAASISYEL